MTDSSKLYRRLIRRSTHRSRSAAVIVALMLVALGAAYVATEAVLAALGAPALLVSINDLVSAIESPGALAIGAAVALAVLGLVLVVLAIAPGRRSRHEIPDERMAVLVDDSVLAGAFVKATVRESRLPASRVTAVVGKRSGRVTITPTSGSLLDRPALERAADAVVVSLSPRPALAVEVAVSNRGVVGS
ncbi:hypothetical protein EYE40_12810 [Glaciihabitans arcticus]|uniref:DNA/RNA endonuclease G n=1 Tax=Glaciihabitans arcticus TaxID=2668039 RepID=A0A4Q9H0I2_9MICO|nr:hypothetical protein [Glaciihabitans arcticus]TBN58200.1 hypothetical protein EYE40_12810 [Glaciihabitans arcticus]